MGAEKLQVLGDIELVSVLGRGQFSTVYLGQRNDQTFAVKILNESKNFQEGNSSSQFYREVGILARCKHKNLVNISKVSAPEEQVRYIVMELVRGMTLAEKLEAQKTMSEEQVINLVLQAASGLQEVHNFGLTHCDLKPQNILFDNSGVVKVIDFGLARGAVENQDSKEIAGSFQYSAPEQTGLINRPIDPRCDLYAIGVIMFECLAGKAPFTSQNVGELLQMHLVAPIPDLKQIRPDIHPLLVQVVNKLMAKDPDDRYQNAISLISDLKDWEKLKSLYKGQESHLVGKSDFEIHHHVGVALIGRENEVAMLDQAFEKVCQRNGQIFVVSGEPGSGKSRLAKELVANAKSKKNAAIIASKASMTGALPFGPIRNAIEGFFSQLEKESVELKNRVEHKIVTDLGSHGFQLKNFAKDLARVFSGQKDIVTEFSQDKMYDALADLLIAMSSHDRPLIFMLDDLQWLDDSSIQVLRRLSTKIENSNLMLLCSMRDGSDGHVQLQNYFENPNALNVHQLKLGRLNLESTKKMVKEYLGGRDVEDEISNLIFHRSQGNAFAVQQYVISMVESGVLFINWDVWAFNRVGMATLNISKDVIQLLLSRTKLLSADTKNTLRYASIVSDEFMPSLVTYLTKLSSEQIDRSLREAVYASLLEKNDNGKFEFVHDRVREAFLSDWKSDELPEVHQKIGDFISENHSGDQNDTFLIAKHYALGEYQQFPKKMFAANFNAAKIALANFAINEAIDFFNMAKKAREFDTSLADADFEEKFGFCLLRNGQFSDAEVHFNNAAQLSSSKLQVARILGAKAWLFRARGEKKAAWDAVNQGYIVLGERPLEMNIFLIFNALFSWAISVLADKYFGSLKKASDPEEIERLKILVELSSKSTYLAFFDLKGHFSILSTFRSSVWARRIGLSKEYIYSLSEFAVLAGSFRIKKPAKWYSEKAVELATIVGEPAVLAQAQVYYAHSAKFQGMDPEAERRYYQVMPWVWKWGDPAMFISAANSLLQILLRRGHYRESLVITDQGLAKCDSIEMKNEMKSYKAAALAGLGQVFEAKALIDEVELYLSKHGSLSAKALHTFNAAIFVYEIADFEAAADKLIEDYENSKILKLLSPPYVRSFLVPAAYIRLEQWRASTPENRETRFKNLMKAIVKLEKFGCAGVLPLQIEPVIKAHSYAIRGAIEVHQGNLTKASEYLDVSEKISVEYDCLWSLFEVYKNRARIFQKNGYKTATDNVLNLAIALGTNQGWRRRLTFLKQEFKLDFSVNGSISENTVGSLGLNSNGLSVSQFNLQLQLDALLELSNSYSAVSSLEDHCRAVMRQMIKLLNPERVFLFLFNKTDGRVSMKLGEDAQGNAIADFSKYSTSIIDRVQVSKEAVVVTGSDQDGDIKSESIMAYDLRSILAVPLISKGCVIGVTYMDSRVAKGIFLKKDAQLLLALSQHIATGIEKMQANQMELDKTILEKDLEVAGLAQALLLPKTSEFLGSQVEMQSYFQPASKAGGDWWWYSQNDNGKSRYLLGDVTGHGPGSAMVTALVTGCYNTVLNLVKDAPSQDLVKILDDIIVKSCGEKYWMILTVVDIDPVMNQVRVLFMGSPNIFIYNNGTVSELFATSTTSPLGSGDFTYSEVVHPFGPGDQLFIFTDGLYEFDTADSVLFGERRLKQLYKKSVGITKIKDQMDYIIENIMTVKSSPTLLDDMTCAIIKYKEK